MQTVRQTFVVETGLYQQTLDLFLKFKEQGPFSISYLETQVTWKWLRLNFQVTWGLSILTPKWLGAKSLGIISSHLVTMLEILKSFKNCGRTLAEAPLAASNRSNSPSPSGFWKPCRNLWRWGVSAAPLSALSRRHIHGLWTSGCGYWKRLSFWPTDFGASVCCAEVPGVRALLLKSSST